MVYDKMGTRGVTLTVLILPTEMKDMSKRSRTRNFVSKASLQIRYASRLRL